MVNLEIDLSGAKYWYLVETEDAHSISYYCAQYPQGHQTFYDGGGFNRLVNCQNKAEYLKLIKLKILW